MDSIRTRSDSSIRLQDETDLALEGLLRKCVGNSMHLHVARQSSKPSKCATQEARFRKKSEALDRNPNVDVYELVDGRLADS